MIEQFQNKKQKQILEAGKELFWKYGIKRVTVEEICQQANVSKMTFYKYFKNKKALALNILDITVGAALIAYEELISRDCPFTEKVNQMLKMKLESTENISQEFMLEIYQNSDLGLKPYMEEQGKNSLALTLKFLLDSQEKGHIRQDLKVDFILYYFNQMIEMATNAKLLAKYERPQDLIMEITEFFFYGIGAKQLIK